MDEFEKELKNGFLEEATQLISDCEQCFLTLESNPSDVSLFDQIFRLAHNLKGSSKAVGFDHMGMFAHHFENLLLKVKNGELKPSPGLVTLLLRCNDHLREMVDTLKLDLSAVINSDELLHEIETALKGEIAEEAPVAIEEPAPDFPAVPSADAFGEEAPVEAAPVEAAPAEVSAAPTLQVAPQIPVAHATPAPEAPKSAPQAKAAAAPADESVRVSMNRLERLGNFVGEMVILQTVLREQALSTNPLLRKTVNELGKVMKEVQDISMSLRMLPLKPVFQKMQRIVRDTAQTLDKKIVFSTAGEDTEVDKVVLENIGDPLVHLVRNAVDHGIESVEKRLAAGKPEEGHLLLKTFHQSGKLIIEVRDDGGGINPEVMRRKGLEKGLLRPGQVITDQEAVNLVFAAGFSTKDQTTEVSGRGVGMDVVRSNIEKIHGEVSIETEVGKGTCFRIVLPLTLAIIDAMVIEVEQERFVLPLYQVHECMRPQASDVQFNVGMGETLLLRGENLPLYRLEKWVGRRVTKPAGESIAIVVRTEKTPFAILVDDILGQQQVVIKKLDETQNLQGFGGCAILGDGRPALILELSDLVRSQHRLMKDDGKRLAV